MGQRAHSSTPQSASTLFQDVARLIVHVLFDHQGADIIASFAMVFPYHGARLVIQVLRPALRTLHGPRHGPAVPRVDAPVSLTFTLIRAAQVGQAKFRAGS